ncbi:glutamate synthase-related protein [Vibrio splendidus]
MDSSVDYIILDGRGGGTAPPLRCFVIISVCPQFRPFARAYLDKMGASGRVRLIINRGLRVPMDFVKAMALGANGVAISNIAMQSIGCVAARMCNTNNCPAGVATQAADLRQRLNVDKASRRLQNFFEASTELMSAMARACGHNHLNQFNHQDLAIWNQGIAHLSGIRYSGLTL